MILDPVHHHELYKPRKLATVKNKNIFQLSQLNSDDQLKTFIEKDAIGVIFAQFEKGFLRHAFRAGKIENNISTLRLTDCFY